MNQDIMIPFRRSFFIRDCSEKTYNLSETKTNHVIF